MNILIIGQGAREHALAWKIAQSPHIQKVFVAPGNAGTATEAKVTNVTLDSMDFDKLCDFVQAEHISLTIVGPEVPLAAGIVDYFQRKELACFGPSQQAAQLEASKIFSKEFMMRNNIPTAGYKVFNEVTAAKAFVDSQNNFPLVIKADGLAAGKGVVIAQNAEEANLALENFMSKRMLGAAGNQIIIEEFLEGHEASFIVITDGEHYIPLEIAQDYKRLLDDDQGPNTGGMGAFSPTSIINAELHKEVCKNIVEPTLAGMRKEGARFVGFLYVGLMIVADKPYVVEYNCRLGDPETQVLMMRLQSDLTELIQATLNGQLAQSKIIWDTQPAMCVILASQNYPQSSGAQEEIFGLDSALNNNVKVFHAGTTLKNQRCFTHGGRVLCVASKNLTLAIAREHCYHAISKIHFQGMQYRNDIAEVRPLK